MLREVNTTAQWRGEIPSDPEFVSGARRWTVAISRHLGADAQTSADLECAVGEALANAVEHGRRVGREPRKITVRIQRTHDHHLVVEVLDSGAAFDFTQHGGRPGDEYRSARGFGIFLMRQLMDEVHYEHRRAGNVVRLIKRIPARQEHAS
ncbi:MAG TPA: ATP-binding protein [Candidatus Dormibacteraeota bacterium]|nr:ATP-binding protein [Candidatus Dormibacteraeota bacterium]